MEKNNNNIVFWRNLRKMSLETRNFTVEIDGLNKGSITGVLNLFCSMDPKGPENFYRHLWF